MTEKVADQSFGEPLELKGTKDELSKFGNSTIKYTRALLLRFNEVDVSRGLPTDFDVLILRELNGESDGTIEKKWIYGDLAGHRPLLKNTWNLGPPGEKWDNHLVMPSKESPLQGICTLESRNVPCHQLPLEDASDAGVLGRTPLKSDLFQLKKFENPYRPPHCNKNRPQPLSIISEPGSGPGSSGEADRRNSADSITGNNECGNEVPFVGAEYSTKKSPVGDCENSLMKNERNEVFVANQTVRERIEEVLEENQPTFGEVFVANQRVRERIEEVLEENQPTFDDFWSEILETIHHISPTNTSAGTPHSELELHSPNEESQISVHHSPAPGNANCNNTECVDSKVNSGDKFNLPDEDSLITIDDLLGPNNSKLSLNPESEIRLPDKDSLISITDTMSPRTDSLMPNRNSMEPIKMTPYTEINTRKSYTITKRGDGVTRVGCTAQSLYHFPGKLQSQKFGPDKNSLHPMCMTPNVSPHYTPPANCSAHPDFHHKSYQRNNSLPKYSKMQQLHVLPHVLFSPSKQVATPGAHLTPSPLQRATYHEGFRPSNAAARSPLGCERRSAWNCNQI